MTLISYLKDRKNGRIYELMFEHAGRCLAVGKSFHDAGKIIASGNITDLSSRMKIIQTEERSADDIEAKINQEIAKSNLPSKISEDLMLFVRTLDRAAGASKRAVINLELISEYNLPEKYAKEVEKASEIIKEIFVEVNKALHSIEDIEKLKEKCRKVDELETEIDTLYTDLKSGYFEVEKVFNSSAALIILDHAFRDLEAAADFGEDAAELLLTLVARRG